MSRESVQVGNQMPACPQRDYFGSQANIFQEARNLRKLNREDTKGDECLCSVDISFLSAPGLS